MHTMMPGTVDRYTQMCNVYVHFKGEQFRVLSLTSFGVIKAPSASSDTWGGTKPGTEEQLKFSYVWSSTPRASSVLIQPLAGLLACCLSSQMHSVCTLSNRMTLGTSSRNIILTGTASNTEKENHLEDDNQNTKEQLCNTVHSFIRLHGICGGYGSRTPCPVDVEVHGRACPLCRTAQHS